MKDEDRQTRSHLMKQLEANGYHPRTDLGQNFLIDLNLLDYVVVSAELDPNDVVLEVGTGTGGMTAALAREAAWVVSVEIDPHMHALATKNVGHLRNVTLLNCDALRNKSTIAPQVIEELQSRLSAEPERRLKLVANLPYCIATPFVSNLVASSLPWQMMVVTIQWELGQKMRARAGSEDYGALSVWLQAQCRVRVMKRLKPTVFWPRPKVDSAIVRLIPHHGRARHLGDREFFHDFVRRLFHQRRKHMRSVLTGMYRQQLEKPEIDAALSEFKFPEGVRAETLDVKTLVLLADRIQAAIRAKSA